MREEFTSEIGKGYITLDEIRDNSHEWVDSYLPVYNNEIIEQWQLMPGEYDDKGSAELEHMGEITIIGLMSLDLFVYYTDIFNEACEELEQEAGE
jgi:hypothetical protein